MLIASKQFTTGGALVRNIGCALAGGIVLGILARLGDRLASPWNLLANTGWPWLLVAFLIGSLACSAGGGSVLGLLALLAAVAAYYIVMFFVDYRMPLSHFLTYGIPDFVVAWAGVAGIGGPVFGTAGATWRSRRGVLHVAAVALMMGAMAGGSISWLVRAQDYSAMPILALGLVCAVLLPWPLLRGRDRLIAYLFAGTFTLLGIIAFGILLITLRTFAR